MVALLPGLAARLDSTERAVVPAGISRSEAPGAKPFRRRPALLGSGPRLLRTGAKISTVPGVSTDVSADVATGIRPIERRPPRRGISLSAKLSAAGSPARAGGPTVAIGQRTIGVRNPQSVTRVVRPGTPTLERPATMEVIETIAMEKIVVRIDRVAEPTWTPAPTAPSKAAEEASDVNTRAEPESKADFRVIERRIITISGRSPDVCGIVDRHINHLRVGRLYFNCRLSSLRLGRHCLLRV